MGFQQFDSIVSIASTKRLRYFLFTNILLGSQHFYHGMPEQNGYEYTVKSIPMYDINSQLVFIFLEPVLLLYSRLYRATNLLLFSINYLQIAYCIIIRI